MKPDITKQLGPTRRHSAVPGPMEAAPEGVGRSISPAQMDKWTVPFGSEIRFPYTRADMSQDGQPLSRALSGQPLPPGTVVSWGLQIARALADLHASGALHRDLKPANVIIDREGKIHLLESSVPFFGTDLALQGMPVLMGAPQYMSPEQVRGEPMDPRSEVFSLGVLLYEMATGKRPFSGSTSEEILADVLRAQPLPARVLVPDIPDTLQEVIQKALSANRAERQQTMDEVVDDHTRAANPSSPKAQQQQRRRSTDRPSGSRSIRPWLLGIAAMAAVVVIAVAAIGVPWGVPVDSSTLLVMPLEVRGQTEGTEYLGRSLAEAIAVNLADAKSLRVLPLPTAEELSGKSALDLAAVARTHGAGRMLTGSFMREGSEANVSVRLVDTVDNRIIWGSQVEVQGGDLSSIGASLARRVAEELGVTFPKLYDYVQNLTGGEAMASSPYTAKAHEAMRQGSIAPLVKAATQLAEAFPDEPDALTLKAHASMLAFDANATQQNRDRLSSALDAVDRLDPQNPYGEFYRAYLLSKDARLSDAVAAQSRLLVRTDLTPAARAWILRYRGLLKLGDQPQSARADLEHALRLDPANARSFHILAETLLATGDKEQALIRAEQAVALMPSYWRHQETLGRALTALGRIEEALRAFRAACDLGNEQSACALFALSLLRSGATEDAMAIANKADKLTAEPAGVYNLACFWALAGDSKSALGKLKRAVELGYALPPHDPDLASLQEEPEYRAIVGEANNRERDQFPE